jgi:2-polyprenyl-3-methyl-5-hydroxy-6-metoxy-1,4-benzoquinol methylase
MHIEQGDHMATIREQAQGIRMMWGGFWTSRILMTANNCGFFDLLDEPKTTDEVATAAKTDPRATEIILNALTALNLLKKQKDRFRNTSLASRFLVSGKPHYQGDILRHANALWKSWSQLDTIVKTGKPAESPHDHPAFIRGMHNIASLIAPEVIKAVGLKGVKKAVDVGGGPGTYSMEMARQGVAVTLFDLPETVAIARKMAKEANLTGVTFKPGNVLVDSLGTGYDLVFISQFIHAFSPEETRTIFAKAFAALKPGGRVAVQEFAIDASGTAPTQGALFSVNMLVQTPGGRCYSPTEIATLLKEAGFSATTSREAGGNVLVVGTKP